MELIGLGKIMTVHHIFYTINSIIHEYKYLVLF
jgi:hypothetical protein